MVKQATKVIVWVSPAGRLRTLRAEWRLRGSKAKVKGKVGEMLRGPGVCVGLLLEGW